MCTLVVILPPFATPAGSRRETRPIAFRRTPMYRISGIHMLLEERKAERDVQA